MGTRKTVKIVAMILGLSGVAFLANSLTIFPMRWMQEVLIESLRTPSANIAYAAQPQAEPFTIDSPVHLAKDLGRPAGKRGESREEKELSKLGKPVPPGQVRKLSRAELLDRCNKLARCKAKLQAAQQGKGKRPLKVLPAGKQGESPEEKAFSNIPKPVNPTPPHRQQGSELILPEESSSLLSWLNPFLIPPAHAQSAFSLHLTPQNRYSSNPYGYMNLYGIGYWGTYYLYSGYITINGTLVDHSPYIFLGFTAPSEGWYLINFQAGRGKAKLRHRTGPVIETWDFSGQSCSACDYLKTEYLTAGWHYFYFWPDGTPIYIYSASVDSY